MIQVLFIYKFINNMMYTKFITIFYTLASKLVFGVVFCAYKDIGGQPNHFEPVFFPHSNSQFLYVSKEDHMNCKAFFGRVKFEVNSHISNMQLFLYTFFILSLYFLRSYKIKHFS